MERYKDLVVQKAEEAFWTSVVESLPLIETGDLDPMSANNFLAEANSVITEWIKQNT